ncbi:hypothetical protein AMTR_s00023p00058930 [Amborella trichopoda]|uniref:Secreted protein n=1 Tax=Amborella trichopoda TaxID=13333 RepID=W1NJ51_AMBTC|nr:hypothetical protein AMTR_s00023p00058930 [Amborella trichopoda]
MKLQRTEIMGFVSVRLLCVAHTAHVDTSVTGICQIVYSGNLDFTKGYRQIPCSGEKGEKGEDD